MHIQRYNLRNFTDKVVYNPRLKTLELYQKVDSESPFKTLQNLDEEKLRKKIGDDTAQKILNTDKNEDGEFVLSGEGLEIGGEGKKKFYDKILPEYLNKLGKKYGVQVETRSLEPFSAPERRNVTPLTNITEDKAREFYYFPITDEMRADLLSEGLPVFAQGGAVSKHQINKMNFALNKKREDRDLALKGGGPIQKGKLKALSNVVAKRMAKGGAVKAATKGAKSAAEAISKAAKSAGAKTGPATAEKDLTTLDDFRVSLGDRLREKVAEANKMMSGFDYLYKPGQRVFTKSSAAKNLPPLEIIARDRYGNNVIYNVPGDIASGKVIDPATGRAKRTPYEPGYFVRQQFDGDDYSEFMIPQSAILGDVDMAKGGAIKAATKGVKEVKKELKELKSALEKAKGPERTPIMPAPNRWFLNPEKFAGPQKVLERAIESSGRPRESFVSGAYIDPRTGEVLDASVLKNVIVGIDPETGRPVMSGVSESGLSFPGREEGPQTLSNLVRRNLYEPMEPGSVLDKTPFIATIEKSGPGHIYGLATEYETPVELYNTRGTGNPTLRPKSRGDIYGLGDVVGQMRIKGREKPHDVWEKLVVVPKGKTVKGGTKLGGGLGVMALDEEEEEFAKGGALSKMKRLKK